MGAHHCTLRMSAHALGPPEANMMRRESTRMGGWRRRGGLHGADVTQLCCRPCSETHRWSSCTPGPAKTPKPAAAWLATAENQLRLRTLVMSHSSACRPGCDTGALFMPLCENCCCCGDHCRIR